jgi:hypothetical protein
MIEAKQKLYCRKINGIPHDEIGLINKIRWANFIWNHVDFQFATAKSRKEKNNKKSNQIVVPKINWTAVTLQ